MIEAKKKHKIIIIEPSVIIISGLKSMLAGNPDFEITNTYIKINTFMERISMLHPDILIINPLLVDYHKRLNIKSLFPSFSPDVLIFAFIHDYIEQETLKQYNGVIEIMDDSVSIIRKLKNGIDNNKINVESNENYELSERENEILASVAKGMTNKEIADTHNISVHTVISHRKNITKKTGIKTVSGLTIYALLNNLIDQSEIE